MDTIIYTSCPWRTDYSVVSARYLLSSGPNYPSYWGDLLKYNDFFFKDNGYKHYPNLNGDQGL